MKRSSYEWKMPESGERWMKANKIKVKVHESGREWTEVDGGCEWGARMWMTWINPLTFDSRIHPELSHPPTNFYL